MKELIRWPAQGHTTKWVVVSCTQTVWHQDLISLSVIWEWLPILVGKFREFGINEYKDKCWKGFEMKLELVIKGLVMGFYCSFLLWEGVPGIFPFISLFCQGTSFQLRWTNTCMLVGVASVVSCHKNAMWQPTTKCLFSSGVSAVQMIWVRLDLGLLVQLWTAVNQSGSSTELGRACLRVWE